MKRILIAEDDPDTALLIQEALDAHLDVVTEHISNGVFVVDGVAGAKPDLLILDVGLPGLNGIDVFDLVRGSDRWGDIPVLFVTAAPERTREAIAPGGLHEVMAKPFDIDALVERVDSLLASAAQAA